MSKQAKASPPTEDTSERIIIRLWPKTPVLYPMAILALICGIVGQIFGVPHELRDPIPAHAPAPVIQKATKGKAETSKAKVKDIVIPNAEKSGAASDPSVRSTAPATAPEPTAPVSAPSAADPAAPEAAPRPEAVETPAVAPMEVSTNVDKGKSGKVQTILALLFLAMLAFSLFVVCIDFEVRWSMLTLVIVLMFIMGLLAADKMGYIKLPGALGILDHFTLYATPLFYYAVFGIWVLLMIVSGIIARFHYIRIESNEVVVMSGVLESQKRMSTFRMHYTKDIQDVFEYWLPFVRSGRLVFTFPNEEHPLVIDNVLGINKVLKKLDRSSSAFQVRGVE